MKDLAIFIKDIGFETGVSVSVRHLATVLREQDIDFDLFWYKDDEELLQAIEQCDSRCINLQGPSFSDETMEKIRATGKSIVLSIHSTMSHLQVEGDVLTRLVDWGKKAGKHFKMTCPSKKETVGLNALSNVEFLYLPNTFSYEIDPVAVKEEARRKSREMNPIKISLFCDYRPFKNLITQVAAVIMLSKKYPVELHMFLPQRPNPLFKNIVSMAEQSGLKLVMHKRMSNRECFDLIGTMHLGLQISLSEAFSYVAFEHMIQGVPVIGSHSIPFATRVAKYNDVTHMARCMEGIISSEEQYQYFALDSMRVARKIRKRNNNDAIKTIQKIIR